MISLNTARWIDRKLGRPICLIISLFQQLRRRKIPPAGKIRKILVIKMWGIGTIVLASPVFYNLKRNCPDAEIYFLTLSQNKGLYENSPYISGMMDFDLSSFRSALFSFAKILPWLWRQKFDIVFDFEFGSRFTAILTFLSLNSFTVGYVPAGSGKAIFDKTVPYNESIHITRIFLRALDALHFKIFSEELLKLPLSQQQKKSVMTYLRERDIKQFIALNPNTSELAVERLWPLERFGELARLLLQRYPGLDIILIGGREDIERVERVQRMIEPFGRVFSTAGLFSVAETAYVLSMAQVFVSNDSGPLHLGVVASVPTIGLFGPETPLLYGPRGAKHRAISAGEICSPCISVYKDKVVDCHKNAVCMKHISVNEVFEAVQERLAISKPLRPTYQQAGNIK